MNNKSTGSGRAPDLIAGLKAMSDWIEKYPGCSPYALSTGLFAEDAEEFLMFCEHMGEYEKGKTERCFTATKHFSDRVSITIYLEFAKAGKFTPDKSFEGWA